VDVGYSTPPLRSGGTSLTGSMSSTIVFEAKASPRRQLVAAEASDLITNAVPKAFRADLLDLFAELVETRTCPRYPCQYAHFTTGWLRRPCGMGLAAHVPTLELARRIAVHRSDSSPNLAPRLAKLAGLWPVEAEGRRGALAPRGPQEPAEARERSCDVPDQDLAIRADGLASTRRHGVALGSEPAP
jgi:hypothetical protein